MKRLKRPLSVFIAALMMLSVLIVAPVTVNAVINSGTIDLPGHWVEPTSISYNDSGYDYMKYSKDDLGDKIIVTRMNPEEFTEPSWGKVWNQSYDMTVPAQTGGSNPNWLFVSGYTGDNNTFLNAGWNGSHHGTADDDYVCVQIFNEYGSIKQYVWTYDVFDWNISNGVLTITGEGVIPDFANASGVPWYDSLSSIDSVVIGEGITGIGNNVLAGLYDKPVTLPTTLTSFNDISSYIAGSITRVDPLVEGSNAIGAAETTKLQTLGVQLSTFRDRAAFRFVTIADSGLLNAASDYGYVVIKTTKSTGYAMEHAGEFNINNVTSKYSCKSTSNNFSGDYGSSDLSQTAYKFISCIVTDAPVGYTVACRFYVTVCGQTYYSTYNGNNGCAYALS